MSSVLGDHIDRFGGGPGGNSEGTFNTNTHVGMGKWLTHILNGSAFLLAIFTNLEALIGHVFA